jgi:hypothetical protein
MADEKELKIDFTGKAVVLIESNWGPIEFSVNDLDTVTAVVRLLLKDSQGNLGVKDYSEGEEEIMKNMLGRIDG